MNALTILQHAYTSIAQSHPEKDAFQIIQDVEDLAKRFAAAVKTVETALSGSSQSAQG